MTNQTEITLTDNAKLHIKKVLEKEPNGLGLRLAVKTTGCSGNQYVIETAKSINEEDKTIEFQGIKIIVDKNSLRYLVGTELDFVRDGLNANFKFNNPNVEESCGCGESFSLKKELENEI
jgi:iron-sulfur cluster assembly protein|tara:strand:+ start:153 stop:512 length:360 start_codon:yes stop_codon:yes gene_type:complete